MWKGRVLLIAVTLQTFRCLPEMLAISVEKNIFESKVIAGT
jgi:hypothetical protein